MERIASGILLMLLLMGMFSLTLNIKSTKAEWTGTVYIRADGSIDPPDAPIVTYDYVTYTLMDNITSTGDGIIVERDNIIIDGAGYTVQGAMAYPFKGIDLTERSNVTIKNIRITGSWIGIYLYESLNNSIMGNSITKNWAGIYLSGSSNNRIIGNNITANYIYGIDLFESSGNNIILNNITNNWHGILLFGSSNNSIIGNEFVANGLLVVYDSYMNAVEGNIINGKPLVYLEGVSNYTVADAGQVVLIRCKNIRVENLNLSAASIGVQLWETNKTIIIRNSITNNHGEGIYLYKSSNNSVIGNSITNNWEDGIYLYKSSNNSVIRNSITNNHGEGISLDGSSNNNRIIGNNITANYRCGIVLSQSSNNTMIGNNITKSWFGIGLSSNNNRIIGNSITNNWFGIDLYFSSNNSIYHNNFINNEIQVQVVAEYANFWDDGYPSGGNYWSDYSGVDRFSGPYQNKTGSDGIGDAPYSIDQNNVDRYPLMSPWKPITLLGDINHDGTINILDIVLIASIYGCKEGEPNWNPEADIAPPYGKIDIFDLVTCAYHYGKKYP